MRRTVLLSIAASLLLFLSCQKEDPVLSIDVTSADFLSEGGSKTVGVTANYKWTAMASDPWIHVSPESGDKGTTSVTVRIDANEKSTTRKGSVSFKMEEVSRSFMVTQAAKFGQQLLIRHSLPSFTVPFISGSGMSALVKWGDGKEDIYNAALKHDYVSAGTYTIEITSAGANSFNIESVAGITDIDFLNF